MSDVEIRTSSIEGFGLFAARPFSAEQRIRQINVVSEVKPASPYGRNSANEPITATILTARSFYSALRIGTLITAATPMPTSSANGTARSWLRAEKFRWPGNYMRLQHHSRDLVPLPLRRCALQRYYGRRLLPALPRHSTRIPAIARGLARACAS
jgi:hypothetical protein